MKRLGKFEMFWIWMMVERDRGGDASGWRLVENF